MKYSLRSLLIVVMLAPPLLAFAAMAIWTYVVVAQSRGPRIQVLIKGGGSVPQPVRPIQDSAP